MPQSLLPSAAVSPLAVIRRYLEEKKYSYDDRRRALALFSTHGDVAHDFAGAISSGQTHAGMLSAYLERIFRK